MASNSSTSSFELTPDERVRPGRFPIAAMVFLLLVVLVEATASAKHEWFADMASWQWETKRALLDAGALNGDVAIFGTSVLFHGLDPNVANAANPGGRVVNLALNGMMLQHQTQLLRERLASGSPPRVVVLEFRHVTVEQASWIRGPYFRFWASAGNFLESRFYYWNLPLGLAFLENRVSTVFRNREAVDNWVFEAAGTQGLPRHTLDRNRTTTEEMSTHAGLAHAAFEGQSLQVPAGPPPPREWAVNPAGELWLQQFLGAAAAAQGVKIVLLLPPAPPYLVEAPGPVGFRARFDAHVARLRAEYPGLGLDVFEPTGYVLEDFADEVHMSAKGRVKLSGDFATWLAGYRLRAGIAR